MTEAQQTGVGVVLTRRSKAVLIDISLNRGRAGATKTPMLTLSLHGFIERNPDYRYAAGNNNWDWRLTDAGRAWLDVNVRSA